MKYLTYLVHLFIQVGLKDNPNEESSDEEYEDLSEFSDDSYYAAIYEEWSDWSEPLSDEEDHVDEPQKETTRDEPQKETTLKRKYEPEYVFFKT